MNNARERFSRIILLFMIDEDLGTFSFSFFFLPFETALAVAENVLEPKQDYYFFLPFSFFPCVCLEMKRNGKMVESMPGFQLLFASFISFF